MYAWALTPYRSTAYLWEVMSAAVKFGMVSSSELLYRKDSHIAHIVILSLSVFGHAYVRPFKDRQANITTVVFALAGVA